MLGCHSGHRKSVCSQAADECPSDNKTADNKPIQAQLQLKKTEYPVSKFICVKYSQFE